MNEKDVLTEVEERRRGQSNLLSTFEEIAQTFLNAVSERRNGTVFTSLQDYLDGSVLINGAYCRRRTILLATHDLKEELEAPSALQSETLVKLELLHLRPVPQVIFYQDIATAILRMEVVIRLEAMQALNGTAGLLASAQAARQQVEAMPSLGESAPGAAGLLVSAQAARQQIEAMQILDKSAPGTAGLLASAQAARQQPWSMPKLKTMGRGLAAVACCAGAITFLSNGYVGELHTGASAQLAANHVETLTDTKWRARDYVLSTNDDVAKQIDGNACTLGASPTYNQQKLFVIGNPFNAAEFVMYSALTKAGLGSVIATSSRGASPVRKTPNYSPWATTVEANNSARAALLSEVMMQ
jgi:hypothetical protein